jgi:hypothetical protein
VWARRYAARLSSERRWSLDIAGAGPPLSARSAARPSGHMFLLANARRIVQQSAGCKGWSRVDHLEAACASITPPEVKGILDACTRIAYLIRTPRFNRRAGVLVGSRGRRAKKGVLARHGREHRPNPLSSTPRGRRSSTAASYGENSRTLARLSAQGISPHDPAPRLLRSDFPNDRFGG